MRTSIKQKYQEFVDYIEFPSIIYWYETNKILASNEYAKEIIGYDKRDIKQLSEDSIRLKYPKELLDNGSKIEHNLIIYNGKENVSVDVEINCIKFENYHLIIWIMQESYKQAFSKAFQKQMPRLFWKNKQMEFLGNNLYFETDFFEGKEKKSSFTNYDILDYEVADRLTEEETELIRNKKGGYNNIFALKRGTELNIFTRNFNMPLYNKNGTVVGMIGSYSIILNREEYKELFLNLVKENNTINEIINASGLILFSLNIEDNSIVYISPNITEYGYRLRDIYSKKMEWSNMFYEEDYELFKRKLNSFDTEKERILKHDFRLVTSDKQTAWLRCEILMKDIGKVSNTKEGVLHNITELKCMQQEVIDTRQAFQLKIEEIRAPKEIYRKLTLFDVLDKNRLKDMQNTISELKFTCNFIVDPKGNLVLPPIGNICDAITTSSKTVYKNIYKKFGAFCAKENKMLIQELFIEEMKMIGFPFVIGEQHLGTWIVIVVISSVSEAMAKLKEENYSEINDIIEQIGSVDEDILHNVMDGLWAYVNTYSKASCYNLELLKEKEDHANIIRIAEGERVHKDLISSILSISGQEREPEQLLDSIWNKLTGTINMQGCTINFFGEQSLNKYNYKYIWGDNSIGSAILKKLRLSKAEFKIVYSELKEKGILFVRRSGNHRYFERLFETLELEELLLLPVSNLGNGEGIICIYNRKGKSLENKFSTELIKDVTNIIVQVANRAASNRISYTVINNMKSILEHMEDLVYIISNMSREILYVNKKVKSKYGDNIIGITDKDFFLGQNILLSEDYKKLFAKPAYGTQTIKTMSDGTSLMVTIETVIWENGIEASLVIINDKLKIQNEIVYHSL